MKTLLHPENKHRQQILTSDSLMVPKDQIKDLESLKAHLQSAIQLEHTTIPPYLAALYSLKQGANPFAYSIIQSVVMEEMLHMILAANILNAIGGQPSIDCAQFVPQYPCHLPRSNDRFLVNLSKFSKSTMDGFIHIEKPQKPKAPPQADQYDTIGQFYKAIELGLIHVNEQHKKEGGIFQGNKELQVGPQHYYGGGGQIIPVTNLQQAIKAIHEIVGQGEGLPGSIVDPDHIMFGEDIEYAHYFKYMEVRWERKYLPKSDPNKKPDGPPVAVDWNAVHNMPDNISVKNFTPGSPEWDKMQEFNKTYMRLLKILHDACNGEPGLILQKGVPYMYDLKYKAQALFNIPNPNDPRQVLGPSFEYVKL